jgi:hypothetical protein
MKGRHPKVDVTERCRPKNIVKRTGQEDLGESVKERGILGNSHAYQM